MLSPRKLGPKKTQYWFRIDQTFIVMAQNLTLVPEFEFDHDRKVPRQGLTFTINVPGLDGVNFQLTKRDKLGIFAPVGAEIEEIVGTARVYLEKAAGTPVKLTPITYEAERRPGLEADGDAEVVANTRLSIALGRCYDILFDINYILSRTFRKSAVEDRRRVKERTVVIKNLLLKHNPSLKREELESEEKKTFSISLGELLSGGVWWGKRFVRWGLKERYTHLLGLAEELPDGPVREEVMASLSLIRNVAPRLDEKLKDLEPVGVVQT